MTNKNNTELQSRKWYRALQVLRFVAYLLGIFVLIFIFIITIPRMVDDLSNSYVECNYYTKDSGLKGLEHPAFVADKIPLSDFGITNYDISRLSDGSGSKLSQSAIDNIKKICNYRYDDKTLMSHTFISTKEIPSIAERFLWLLIPATIIILIIEGIRFAIIYIVTGKLAHR